MAASPASSSGFLSNAGAERSRAPRPIRPPIRASDADREATVRVLQDAVARGLLTFDEGGERMSAAYGARFVTDLPPLTADLPPAPVQPTAPGWARWREMTAAQLRASFAGGPASGVVSSRLRLALLLATLLAITLLLVAGYVGHEVLQHGGPGFGGGFDRFHDHRFG